jgi:hypothetical protein
MINHARTLLMNVSSASNQRQEIGEEYIPANYAPLTLPSYLQSARRILFGTAPDRYFLNFRVRELMAHLHQTELAEFVYALDPRVTYWPEVDRPFYDTEKRLVATQYFGLDAQPPYFRGDLFADNTRGRSVREFTLRVTEAEGDWEAILAPLGRTGGVVTTPLTFTDGLSQLVPLENTGVSVQIPLPTMTTDWTIYTRVRPGPVLTTAMPILEVLGEPLFLELFGVGIGSEPFATFKALWFDHPNPIYRLGGLTLATIYRTNEILKTGAKTEVAA